MEASVAWSTWALHQGIIAHTHLNAETGHASSRARSKQKSTPVKNASEGSGRQTVVPAVVHFLGMLPDLTGAVAEGISTSALAGCERDCAKLAAKAMVLLQQVQFLWLQHLMLELAHTFAAGYYDVASVWCTV